MTQRVRNRQFCFEKDREKGKAWILARLRSAQVQLTHHLLQQTLSPVSPKLLPQGPCNPPTAPNWCGLLRSSISFQM